MKKRAFVIFLVLSMLISNVSFMNTAYAASDYWENISEIQNKHFSNAKLVRRFEVGASDTLAIIDQNDDLYMAGFYNVDDRGYLSHTNYCVKVMSGVKDIYTGYISDCYVFLAVKTDGTLVAWGDGYNEPTRIAGNVDRVAWANGERAYYIKNNGQLCRIAYLSDAEKQEEILMSDVKDTNWYCKEVLKTDGSLWRWNGKDGEGDWLNEDYSQGAYKFMDNIKSLAEHTVITNDGELWGWGELNYESLGWRYSFLDQLQEPQKIMDDVIQCGNCFAVTSDGDLYQWARLDGAVVYSDTPDLIDPGTVVGLTKIRSNVEKVFTDFLGDDINYILLEDGSLIDTNNGEIILDNVAFVDPCEMSVGGAAIKRDGSVWVWGEGGLFGDGSSADSDVPVEFGGNGEPDDPDDPDEPEEKTFELKRDANRYAHWEDAGKYKEAGFVGQEDYRLDRKYYWNLANQLTESQVNALNDEMRKKWEGSCYGIASTMALVYNDILSIDDISNINNGTYYSMAHPRYDSKLRNSITYCNLAQVFDGIGGRLDAALTYYMPIGDSILDTEMNCKPSEFFKEMVAQVKKAEEQSKVLIFTFNNHAVLATGYEYDSKTAEHVIYLYDENTSGKSEEKIKMRFTEMRISPAYQSGTFETQSGIYKIHDGGVESWNVYNMFLVDPSKIAYYGKNKATKKASAIRSSGSDSALVKFPVGSKITIENAEGQTLVYESINGILNEEDDNRIEIKDAGCYTSGNADYIELEIPSSDTFTVKSINGIDSNEALYGSDIDYDFPVQVEVNGEAAALDVSITNNGRYASVATTDIESATFNSDGTISIEPKKSGNTAQEYTFDVYSQMDMDKPSSVGATGTASTGLITSSNGSNFNLEESSLKETGNIDIDNAACYSAGLNEELSMGYDEAEGLYSVDIEEAVENLNNDTSFPIDEEYIEADVEGWTYTGRSCEPYVYIPGLTKGSDYKVEYKNNVNAGKGQIVITGIGEYGGSVTKSFTISKAANTLSAAGKTAKLKAKKLKKKAQTLTAAKAITIARAQGKVTYKLAGVTKSKFKKYFKVNTSTGKITAKKGLKKGTYKVKVNVTASGNGNYNPATKQVIVTVKVK